MRLTRLKIIRHRWCAPTELILGAKRQLVLGKNGTGKTRLLELIARVCAGDLPWLMAEPIEFEADWSVDETSPHFEGAVKGILRLTFSCVHRPMQRSHIDTPMIDHARLPVPVVQFRLSFDADSESVLRGIEWRCSDGKVADSNGLGGLLDVTQYANIWNNTFERSFHLMLDQTVEDDRGGLLHYYSFLGVFGCRRFDEALGEYNKLMSHDVVASNQSRGDGVSRPYVVWGGDGDLLFAGSVPAQLLGEGELAIPAKGVAFLKSVERILTYVPLDVRFRFARTSGEGRKLFNYDAPRIYLRLPNDGDTITDNDLSFGETRALSFLAHLSDSASRHIIIADELMNGLHHSLGVALLDEIGDRQAFLATHEPVLMDEVDFESADELRRSLLLCRRNPDPKGPPFVWTQLSPEEAAEVFPYYPKSLMHGSQILKHWELW